MQQLKFPTLSVSALLLLTLAPVVSTFYSLFTYRYFTDVKTQKNNDYHAHALVRSFSLHRYNYLVKQIVTDK